MGIDDFELLQIIGRGACGKVLVVQKKEHPDAGELFAMKILKKDWVLDKVSHLNSNRFEFTEPKWGLKERALNVTLCRCRILSVKLWPNDGFYN